MPEQKMKPMPEKASLEQLWKVKDVTNRGQNIKDFSVEMEYVDEDGVDSNTMATKYE